MLLKPSAITLAVTFWKRDPLDRDTERLLVVEPERTILLTTWDFLRQLEDAGRIQSADAVMDAVRQVGRHPPRRDLWQHHDPEVRDAVRTVIAHAHDGAVPKEEDR